MLIVSRAVLGSQAFQAAKLQNQKKQSCQNHVLKQFQLKWGELDSSTLSLKNLSKASQVKAGLVKACSPRTSAPLLAAAWSLTVQQKQVHAKFLQGFWCIFCYSCWCCLILWGCYSSAQKIVWLETGVWRQGRSLAYHQTTRDAVHHCWKSLINTWEMNMSLEVEIRVSVRFGTTSR